MLERTSSMRAIVLALAFVAQSLTRAEAGSPLDRAAAMGRIAGRFEAFSRKVPPAILNKLSSGVRNSVNLARRWKDIGPVLSSARRQELALPMALPEGASLFAPIGVSPPGADRKFSRWGGFVQSETSTAWCGSNIVVAYNDSASIFRSVFGASASGSPSFGGYAVSTNSGASFTGGAVLIPDPLPAGVIERDLNGDPVVACTSKTNFFFSTLALDTLSDESQISGVTVSSSTDGGFTFGPATMAAGKDATTHILDKDWFAVDPTDPARLYVTYSDFDITGALCGVDTRSAIEIVSSTDGGATWSSPTVVKETCFASTGAVQGSQVVVGSGGTVYVAYESFDISGAVQIEVARSSDHAQTFGTPVVVSSLTSIGGVNFVGADETLQGGFRTNEFPSLTIDRGRKAALYVAWNDGLNGVVFDPLGIDLASPTYAYADVLVSRSTDHGETWSAPVRVNNNAEPPFVVTGSRTDQYEPGVAVDQTSGTVGVCFYDRRRDANNFRIDRECAKSTDSGSTWTNTRITGTPFAPEIGQDILVDQGYMGDYDTVASDFLRTQAGFFGAWGDNTKGNPDVRGSRF